MQILLLFIPSSVDYASCNSEVYKCFILIKVIRMCLVGLGNILHTIYQIDDMIICLTIWSYMHVSDMHKVNGTI